MMLQSKLSVCDEKMCNGCYACKNVCPKEAILIEDCISYYDAKINSDKCINCGLCKKVCPNVNRVQMKSSKNAFQGWSNDFETRKRAASGGIASELAKYFIENGGVVCTCVCNKGKFEFDLIDNILDINRMAGSKYIKSNPDNIYQKVKTLLNVGTKVLYIGLPCQVAAIRNFTNESQRKYLYTVDLICHGTPSPKILDCFLQQRNIEKKNIETISFRDGNRFSVCADGNVVSLNGGSDAYSIAFLSGLTYTDNCYVCQFANEKRVSDITIGDSWGSNLDESEKRKGVSLILCQTDRGLDLIRAADIYLTDVNVENAMAHNQQLREPSRIPKNREYVMKNVKGFRRFEPTVFLCEPVVYCKQVIKSLLHGIMKKK